MLDFDNNSDKELMYREMLDKVVIHNNNILEVYLKSLPFGIGVKYLTAGRLDNYTVNIEDIMFDK